jgi:hypothetical protein
MCHAPMVRHSASVSVRVCWRAEPRMQVRGPVVALRSFSRFAPQRPWFVVVPRVDDYY